MLVNQEILEQLKNSNNVAIFIHINPDADCLGSASALKEALGLLGKQADIFCDDEVPDNYLFIPHIDKISIHNCKNYDLAISLDCSDRNRLGKNFALFQSINKTIKIDHHKTQDNFALLNDVQIVSSCCLIMYFYIQNLVSLNSNIALSLYCGIAGDTGCFMHSNTTSLEHKIASELLNFPFDLEKANYYLFKHRTLSQAMLTKLAYNNIVTLCNGKLALITLMLKDFEATKTTRADTLGLSDIVVNLDGVMVGVIISEEKDGLFSCSFRSSGMVDVSLIAQSFGGGGHARAAGCNIFGRVGTVVKKIENEFVKQLQNIQK